LESARTGIRPAGGSVRIIAASAPFLGLEEPEASAALRPHADEDRIMLTVATRVKPRQVTSAIFTAARSNSSQLAIAGY
jgi:hypothetical protein